MLCKASQNQSQEACTEGSMEPKELLQHCRDFERRFAGTFQEHFASHERATYMIMAEAREILLLNNSLAHLIDVQTRSRADTMITIVALDAEVQELCQNYSLLLQGRIDCVNLTGWIAEKFLGGVSNCFGSAAHNFVISTKPFLLSMALTKSRFGILNMDADVVVRNDLLGYVQNASAVGHHKILASIDSITDPNNTAVRLSNMTNTGILFATPEAFSIIEAWARLTGVRDWGPLGDQAAFDALRRVFPSVNKTVERIPIEVVAGGGWKAEYAGHYNACGKSVAEKIANMKENGEWRGPE